MQLLQINPADNIPDIEPVKHITHHPDAMRHGMIPAGSLQPYAVHSYA
jgi:hypothetical protein